MLGLATLEVKSKETGEIDTENLKELLDKHFTSNFYGRFIFSCTFGTSIYGAIDNIPEVHNVLTELKSRLKPT